MKVKFYTTDVEKETIQGGKFIQKGVLFFSLERNNPGNPTEPPTSFDNRATRDHVLKYRDAYKAFKRENPDYECAWPELEVHVEAPKKGKKKKGKAKSEAKVEEAESSEDKEEVIDVA